MVCKPIYHHRQRRDEGSAVDPSWDESDSMDGKQHAWTVKFGACYHRSSSVAVQVFHMTGRHGNGSELIRGRIVAHQILTEIN